MPFSSIFCIRLARFGSDSSCQRCPAAGPGLAAFFVLLASVIITAASPLRVSSGCAAGAETGGVTGTLPDGRIIKLPPILVATDHKVKLENDCLPLYSTLLLVVAYILITSNYYFYTIEK